MSEQGKCTPNGATKPSFAIPLCPTNSPCVSFSHLSKLTDEQVMEHLKSGHGDALAVLFDRYHRLVLSTALRMLRDAGEAEDLMQTVFFEIYRAAGHFDPRKGAVRVWILQYAYHRSLNRRQYLSARGFYEAKESRAPEEQLLSASECNGLNCYESARLVREGLAALTKRQRKTLELAFFEGLSMTEIANRLNESVGNVRHHYYRGMEKLRIFVYGAVPSTHRDAEPQPEIANVKA